MATKTEKTNLEKLQADVTEVGKTIVRTNRTAFRTYLDAAFRLQRAGLEALGLFQNELEKQTVKLVDRAEDAQDKVAEDVQARLKDSIAQLQESREKGMETLNANIERLREAREKGLDVVKENREKVNDLFDSSIDSLRDVGERLRANAQEVQSRLRLSRDELDEAGDLTESRVREAAEIALKVARVLEHRIESVIGELVELGRREWHEIESRVDSLVDRLDAELDDEITPIANYDDKTVEEVLTEIDGLDHVQLRVVRAHETNHKNRITVLRAIDEKLALSGPSIVERVEKRVNDVVVPVAGYAEKNAEEAIAALKNLGKETELSAVRAYEAANKNRVTVLRAIDEKIADIKANI
jgi:hypothetical protein